MNETEKWKQVNKLARDVLILSRNTLLVNLRFLDIALSKFEYVPIKESTLLTDGELILYNPQHLLENYKLAKEIPVRDYLHIVIEDKQCIETLFKDNQEVAKNTHNLKFLTSYIEDKDYLILIFNKVEFVCLKKAGVVGDLNKLKSHLQKTMAKK